MGPSSGQRTIRRFGTESFAKPFSLWGGILLLATAPPPQLPVLEFCCSFGNWSNHFVIMRPQTQRCKTNTWNMVDKERWKEPSFLMPSLSYSPSSGLHSFKFLIW